MLTHAKVAPSLLHKIAIVTIVPAHLHKITFAQYSDCYDRNHTQRLREGCQAEGDVRSVFVLDSSGGRADAYPRNHKI